MRRAVVGRELNRDATLVERDRERFCRKQMTARAAGREQDHFLCISCGHGRSTVMPGPVPGIHVFHLHKQDVDGTRNSGLPELRKRLNRLSQVG
jgi:hypothetical protein